MNETSNKRDSKDNEVVMLEERVESEKNLKDELKKAYEEAVEHSDEFFYKLQPKDESADIIRELLLTNKREIEYTSFTIEDMAVESISTYGYEKPVINSFLDDQAKTIESAGTVQNQSEDSLSATTDTAYTVGVYGVTTDVECDLGDLFDFADNLLTTTQKSFILQDVTIEAPDGDTLVGAKSGDVEGTITYKYYMAPEIPKPAALAADDKDNAKEESKDDSSES